MPVEAPLQRACCGQPRPGWLRAGLLLWLLVLVPALGHAASIAFTFDDGLDPAKTPEAAAWNDRLLQHLGSMAIEAMVFPSLRHTGGSAGKPLVARWAQAGHAVGNHTSRHRSLGSPAVSLQDFVQDVAEADAAFADLPTWKRLLRFPYLKEGETAEKRDAMRAWMAENHYAAAPVSVDTSDWYFNEVFLALSARGETARLADLRPLYVEHIVDRAAHYDALALQVLGRSPAHVLLLHVNAINAHWLPDVVQGLRAKGWSVVPATQAFGDRLYAMQPKVLPAGESIVWSLARQGGVAGLRYPAEDARYEAPRLRAAGLVP